MPARAAAQVVTIYDLFFLHDSAGTASEIRRDYPALSAIHARRADAVVVISEYTARRSDLAAWRGTRADRPLPARRTLLEPSGRDAFLRTDPVHRQRRAKEECARAVARVCTASLAAARRTGAGHGRSSARFRFRDHGDDLAGPRSTRMSGTSGYVTDEERQRLYRSASMLVVPSLDEGFGMPVVEAMTIGVPVVAANRGALPEVSGDAAQLVDPLDDEGDG